MRRELAFFFGTTDLAPIAVFRIVYGILAFNWFWQLYPNLTQFFTDEGLFPRTSQVLFFPRHFTLLNSAGELWQVTLFWGVALVATAMLAAGFHTRAAAVMTFVAIGSFGLRNPLMGDASDQVFRAAAFWLAFTRAGDRFSVDAAFRRTRGEPELRTGPALPVRIVELQFAWIYLATGLEKLGGELWTNGTAVYYSLQLEHTFARPWAAGLAWDATLARLATHGTVVAEILFLPFVFLPVVRRFGRPVAVTVAAGLHLSIIAFMNVGNFPAIMLAGLIPFVPAGAVDRVVRRLSAAAGRTGAARDRVRTSADPRTGSVTAAPTSQQVWSRRLATTALVALALTVFSTALPASYGVRLPDPTYRALQYVNLVQSWNMFAPDPATADGWLRIPALLANGNTVDLVTGRAPSDEPLRADPLYSRWTKVTEWIAAARNAEFRLEYSRMYCRLRNLHLEPGESPIISFDLVYTERRIPPPGQPQPPLRPILLGSHRC